MLDLIDTKGKKDIKSMTLEEVTAEMTALGEKSFRAKQLYDWLHVKLAESFDDMSTLSKDLRQKLKDHYSLTALQVAGERISAIDGTRKYLFRLEDGNVIESVWMQYHHGNSVCISSQVGCRMGCRFCASTLDGMERNLRPSEMLDQIYRIQTITGERVSNIVIMGSGEPMDNYDNVVRFIRLISSEKGLNISQRNLTVSTCGIVPGIRKFAEEGLQVTLALSLHAPNDEVRKTLMPIANSFKLKDVLEACHYYFEKTGRRLTFEYSLVKGVNDNLDEAKALTELIKDQHGHVNLIPVNPIKERDYVQSDRKSIEQFKNYLERHGINATVRREMGRDIGAIWRKGRSDMEAYALTDTGRVRSMNQDYIYASPEKVGSLPDLFLVADGMGGHKAGDYASRFMVENLVVYLNHRQDDPCVTQLKDGIKTVNKALYEMSLEREEFQGMGCTLVAAVIEDGVLYAANIGDSRLYLIHDGVIRQITRDHSYVEEMVAMGMMKRGSADYNRKKNIITRAAGIQADIEPDFFEEELGPEDYILLCSDGLSNMVDNDTMCSIILSEGTLKEKAERLIAEANERGGTDNIAAVLVKPQEGGMGSC